MKTYFYMIFAILVSFLLSLNSVKIFSLEEISLFLTVIGLVYGLISAFTINNAWERFSKIRDGISNETNSLIMVYILSKKFSDKVSFRKLKNKILDYSKDVPKIEWHDYWKSEETHKKFREITEIFSGMKLRNEKDEGLFDAIGEELRNASAARNAQLVLSQSRISKVQWVLNIFLSVILIGGLVFLSIPNYVLSIFIIASTIAAILMIIVVIYELDSMKVAEEEVSNEPHRQVVRIISKE